YPIGHQWQCDSSGDLSCIRGTAGHSQTLCEALSGAWSSGLFCTCQEALGQQIDCGSLPTGPRLIGPRTDCARSGSGSGDFVQYIAQGDPRGSSAAWKKKDLSDDAIASTKSERSIADIQAPLGRATTRSLERVAASVGLLNGAPIEFELVKDVPDGGVLLALPALLLLGLFSKSREMFSMPEGFYPLESIFLLLALMALARIPSLEALRCVAPEEWGKLMGLDRIPGRPTLKPLYHRFRPRRLLATLLWPDERGAH